MLTKSLLLGTYSNLENHPKLIRAREATKARKIQLDPKTGLPSVKSTKQENQHAALDDNSIPTRGRPFHPSSQIWNLIITLRINIATRVTVTRRKDETKQEKRARKQAAKEERQERRVEKKATQTKFANEKKHQLNSLSNSKRGIRKLQILECALCIRINVFLQMRVLYKCEDTQQSNIRYS